MKLFLILFICCLFSQQLLAKKLYKYKDQQGLWHYSDKPPETKQEVEVRQMKAGRKRYIWLEKTGDKHHPRYFAINNYHGPVEIEAVLKKANNAQTKPALPKQFIVEPGQSEALFEVGAINEYRSWGYSLQYRYNIGSPLAVHDQQAVYLAPFATALCIRENIRAKSRSLILLLLIGAIVGIYTFIVNTKITWYIMPVYPIFAILIGSLIVQAQKSYQSIAFAGLLSAVLLSVLIAQTKLLYFATIMGLLIVIAKKFRLIREQRVNQIVVFGIFILMALISFGSQVKLLHPIAPNLPITLPV